MSRFVSKQDENTGEYLTASLTHMVAGVDGRNAAAADLMRVCPEGKRSWVASYLRGTTRADSSPTPGPKGR